MDIPMESMKKLAVLNGKQSNFHGERKNFTLAANAIVINRYCSLLKRKRNSYPNSEILLYIDKVIVDIGKNLQ